jgi:glycerol-3-phosphate dehydrogenase
VAAEAERARGETGNVLDAQSITALVATHGTAWRKVVEACRIDPAQAAPIAPGAAFPTAAVRLAVEEEMACTLADVLIRRLPIGAGGHPGDEAVSRCGAVMAALHGWDARRLAAEADAVRDFYRVW